MQNAFGASGFAKKNVFVKTLFISKLLSKVMNNACKLQNVYNNLFVLK